MRSIRGTPSFHPIPFAPPWKETRADRTPGDGFLFEAPRHCQRRRVGWPAVTFAWGEHGRPVISSDVGGAAQLEVGTNTPECPERTCHEEEQRHKNLTLETADAQHRPDRSEK